MIDHDRLARALRRAALEAGAAIMAVRARGPVAAETKADHSPVTAADLAADRVLARHLAPLGLPVVSEERAASHGAAPPGPFLLVDPLDGTKEFLKGEGQGGGDFTVNVALIEDGRPTRGVVFAPARGRLFRTLADGSAVEEDGPPDPASEGPRRPLRAEPPGPGGLRVVASKSHRDAATDAWIARLAVAEFVAAGSSLKFCLVAAGEADLYPRLGRTMEWDTAAGHAVLAAAGGAVETLDGRPLRYGKPAWENPHFVAAAPGAGWPREGA